MNTSIFHLLCSLLKIRFSSLSNKKAAYKQAIYHNLTARGGIYIKFLQILSVSNKFMEGWSTPKDYEVFNKVSTEYIDIKRYLKNPSSYEYVEDTPFRSGSFAQIYRAKLKSGEEVVIKMLKPSIYHNLEHDLKKLKRIVKIVSFFLPASIINYLDAYEEFAKNCLLEIDYDNEIANMEYFIEYYHNHKSVVIPRLYKDLCAKNLIVQEYIPGPTIADLITIDTSATTLEAEAKRLTGSDFWEQIAIAGGEALRTAMTSDYVYGDPHPGNIILLSNNRIAIVDFGLIARKPLSQEAFYLFVKSYYDILNGHPEFDKLLQASCMCFCPDITCALKKYFGAEDFISTASAVLNKEAKNLITTDEQIFKNVSNGHLMSIFLDSINTTKSINIKVDMRNYELLKA
ncbi:MAG: AarF/ABC1/UbiB kinase family protein, partial [Bacilli bacterium]|nr:AarF/ABC1/UbiB kinase family protein [Bacilli bacterium]